MADETQMLDTLALSKRGRHDVPAPFLFAIGVSSGTTGRGFMRTHTTPLGIDAPSGNSGIVTLDGANRQVLPVIAPTPKGTTTMPQ